MVSLHKSIIIIREYCKSCRRAVICSVFLPMWFDGRSFVYKLELRRNLDDRSETWFTGYHADTPALLSFMLEVTKLCEMKHVARAISICVSTYPTRKMIRSTKTLFAKSFRFECEPWQLGPSTIIFAQAFFHFMLFAKTHAHALTRYFTR